MLHAQESTAHQNKVWCGCGCSHGGVLMLLRKASQLASALVHMHSQSPPMVHQDLHRGNVLATLDKKSWNLIDLGAASYTHNQGSSVTVTEMM